MFIHREGISLYTVVVSWVGHLLESTNSGGSNIGIQHTLRLIRSGDAGSYTQHAPYTDPCKLAACANHNAGQLAVRFPKCFYFLPGRPHGRHWHGIATTELAANGVFQCSPWKSSTIYRSDLRQKKTIAGCPCTPPANL